MNNTLYGINPSATLMSAFDQYYINRNDAIKGPLAAAKICAMFLSIQKKPFFFFYWQIILAHPYVGRLINVLSKSRLLLKLTAAPSRGLQDLATLDDPLLADSSVLIRSTDPLFSSTVGGEGTTLDGTGSLMTVNTSMIFP